MPDLRVLCIPQSPHDLIIPFPRLSGNTADSSLGLPASLSGAKGCPVKGQALWGQSHEAGSRDPFLHKCATGVTERVCGSMQSHSGLTATGTGMKERVSILHCHRTLAIGQVDHNETVVVGLRGDARLAAEHVKGGPGGDRLLQASQAAATVGKHEVIEGVWLEVRDQLLGSAAVHVQCEPIILNL